MLRGLANVSCHADDVAAAEEWYRERGGGFVTASVLDPFGNVLGVMYNPHFLEVLAKG